MAAGPVAAHEDHDHGSAPDCTKAELAKLRQAKDNFAAACQPGADLAAMNDSAATLAAGDEAAEDMELVANIPKQGAFAAENAYNSDLAFSGKYAYAGNYEGFSVYDISRPTKPRLVSQVVCPGSQNDISVHGKLPSINVSVSGE